MKGLEPSEAAIKAAAAAIWADWRDNAPGGSPYSPTDECWKIQARAAIAAAREMDSRLSTPDRERP